jgi:methylenetetrahydrofolate reductase (NADPH)
LKPAFCSVTFGAGGSTREGTLSTVLEFRAEGMQAAPHISCMGGARESLAEVLAQYKAHDIRHLVALRGDLPSVGRGGDFRFASELVAFIREETGDWFHIDVTAYPECRTSPVAAGRPVAFKKKSTRGQSAITQYFYNPDAYWHFVDACSAAGITVPVVGHHADRQLLEARALFRRFGAEIRWIRMKLQGYGDDLASIRAFGLDVVTDGWSPRARRAGAALHALNQAALTTTIWQRLGLD